MSKMGDIGRITCCNCRDELRGGISPRGQFDADIWIGLNKCRQAFFNPEER